MWHRRLAGGFTGGDACVTLLNAVPFVTDTFPPDVNGVAMTLGRLVGGLRARGHLVHVHHTAEGRLNHATNLPSGVYFYLLQAGDAAAQNNLGALLRDGYGVDKDVEQAVAWFRKAAELGHTKAMLNLGALYEQQARASGGAAAPQAASPAAAPTAIPLSAPTAPVATPLQ